MMTNTMSTAAQIYAETQRRMSPAAVLFNATLSAGQRRRFCAGLLRRPTALRTLGLAGAATGGRSAGRRQVRLADIRGTEGRAGDFDNEFYPMTDQSRRRWESVAEAMEAGLVLPPVQLIQVGGEYFVRDGHHRVSVARALEQDTIEADVTIWTTN
jgi:hypothetical protein